MNAPTGTAVRPAHLTQLLAEVGPIWGRDIIKNRERVIQAYTAVLADTPKAGIEVTRDIAYGRHARQVLDVYRPDRADNAPVMVFVHGGAFVRGDKDVNAEIYGNVLYYFARQGYVGVNMEYRHGHDAPFPGGAEDVAGAMAWVQANIASYGGNPVRIFLFGHSAGGTHTAHFAWDQRVRPASGTGLAGHILMSARLRADVSPHNPNAGPVKIYFGDDESTFEANSPLSFAMNATEPTFIIVAQYENPLLDLYGAETYGRLQAFGRPSRFMRVAEHNHNSIVSHFNTEEDEVGRAILSFMQEA